MFEQDRPSIVEGRVVAARASHIHIYVLCLLPGPTCGPRIICILTILIILPLYRRHLTVGGVSLPVAGTLHPPANLNLWHKHITTNTTNTTTAYPPQLHPSAKS